MVGKKAKIVVRKFSFCFDRKAKPKAGRMTILDWRLRIDIKAMIIPKINSTFEFSLSPRIIKYKDRTTNVKEGTSLLNELDKTKYIGLRTMTKAPRRETLGLVLTSLSKPYVVRTPTNPNIRVEIRSVVNENPKGRQKIVPQMA